MATNTFALRAVGINVDLGHRSVLDDVDLTITERSRIAVVGPNGVGKTTLFRILVGELEPSSGVVSRTPETTTVGLVRQELDRTGGATVRSHVAQQTGVGPAATAFERTTEDVSGDKPGSAERYDAALALWLRLGGPDFESRLEAVADDLGLAVPALQLHPAALSGGQAARVGLAAVMLSRFDITLLDEPTNDLDLAGLARLEDWVDGHPGALAVISHDRAFLERSVTSVLEIDEHSHTATHFQGGWASFMEERRRARVIARQRHSEYQAERERLATRSQQQREWADKGASRARKRPADADKLRRNWNIAQTEKLMGRAKATLRSIDRLEQVDKPWEGWDLRLTIHEAPRSASVVAALDRAVVRRGDFAIGPVDMEIRWAERVRLIGPNGCGKSTLIEALLGRLPLASGTASIGAGVVVGELDQVRGGLDHGPTTTVLGSFQESTGLPVSEARSVLAKFGIDATAVGRSVRSLSPGERTRAYLALFQARGANFLVLDEPTNHLDLEAIEQLESALNRYGGTLLLVSHDRRLLEQVEFTRIIDVDSVARPGLTSHE
jgi:ATPase subunit of ABC transporter with duplicated ATPase domains